MRKTRERIIVLGRLENWHVPTGRSRPSVVPGVQPFPELEEILWPRCHFWTRRERQGDLNRAQAYAKREGYEVMVYPKGTRKPLDRAKARIRELHGG